MDIGNQLKNTRVLLGLTQEEFSAGVVTESFYSRVENNKSNISMNDLLKILNYHHISLYNFFATADIMQLKKGIMQAFINHDRKKLSNYRSLSGSKKYQLEFKIMFAILNNKVDSLPTKTVQEAQQQLLKVGKMNEDALFNVNLLVYLVDYRFLITLIDYLIDFTEIDEMSNFALQLLYHCLLAVLKRCYEETDQVEAEKVLNFLDKVPHSQYLFLEQLLAKGYRCLFVGKRKKLESILSVLRLTGYDSYISDLER